MNELPAGSQGVRSAQRSNSASEAGGAMGATTDRSIKVGANDCVERARGSEGRWAVQVAR